MECRVSCVPLTFESHTLFSTQKSRKDSELPYTTPGKRPHRRQYKWNYHSGIEFYFQVLPWTPPLLAWPRTSWKSSRPGQSRTTGSCRTEASAKRWPWTRCWPMWCFTGSVTASQVPWGSTQRTWASLKRTMPSTSMNHLICKCGCTSDGLQYFYNSFHNSQLVPKYSI